MGARLQVSALFVIVMLGFSSANAAVFDIRQYGSVHPGSDITQALLKAFGAACESGMPSRVVIPKGTYKLGKVELAGPCKSKIHLNLQGTVQADGDDSKGEGEWVVFSRMDDFHLNGGGVFDGQGNSAWKVNNCHKTFNCAKLPISIRFDFITNSVVTDITSMDAKNFHMNVLGCKNLTIKHVKITAPEDSPNTDGIHTGRSNGIKILNSFISTGDDCISVGDGTHNLHVEGVTCGPGHGLSIGSLGRYGFEESVSGIRVRNCTLQKTDNGLRIKTWPSSACSTSATDIHFEDIIMDKVNNAILIDQEYCPWNQCNKNKPSTIKLANISFKHIRGTAGNKDAVKLLCSKGVPCQNVEIGDIDLKYSGPDGLATFECSSVQPRFTGIQFPKACSGPVIKPLGYKV